MHNKAPFFGTDHISIADLSLYPYTHNADKAGYDLGKYPCICRWLDEVSNIPSFMPLSWQPDDVMSFADYIKIRGTKTPT